MIIKIKDPNFEDNWYLFDNIYKIAKSSKKYKMINFEYRRVEKENCAPKDRHFILDRSKIKENEEFDTIEVYCFKNNSDDLCIVFNGVKCYICNDNGKTVETIDPIFY